MKRHDPRRVLLWLERGLALSGLIALGAVGLTWLDATRYQATARAELEAALERGGERLPSARPDLERATLAEEGVPEGPDGTRPGDRVAEPPDVATGRAQDGSPRGARSQRGISRDNGEGSGAGSGARPDRSRRAAAGNRGPGAPLALLEAPRLGLSVVVAEGIDGATLRRAVGHMPQTPRPGEPGNSAIAGHRDTHFLPLKEIRAGDELTLQTSSGSFRYEVEWIRIVEPTALEVIAPTDHPALTLITCYPFSYLGDAPHRFVVRARQVS
jgi:LPXTG-site transpeptidase (sortase) family protein